jgi:hypothetical protein
MGNKDQALETLAPIATTKKQKHAWSKKLELLVTKFCLLCVELNKPSKARECLYNFKSISYVSAQLSLSRSHAVGLNIHNRWSWW